MVNNCPSCKKKVTQPSICCDGCEKWLHKRCSGVSEEEFKVLCKKGCTVQFHCISCKAIIQEIFKDLKSFKEAGESIRVYQKRLEDLEAKVAAKSDSVGVGEKVGVSTENLNVQEQLDTCKTEVTSCNEKVRELESEVKLQLETCNTELTSFNDRIRGLEQEFEKLAERARVLEETTTSSSNSAQDSEIRDTIAGLASLEDYMNVIDLKGDAQDQYTRRETIRVSNISEEQNENLRAVIIRIAADCGVTINGDHISVVHRNGPRVQGRPRDIVCKFTIRDIKHDLLRNKHHLRRMSGYRYVYIDEHLTPLRARITKALRDAGHSVRTVDGKIYTTKLVNGQQERGFYDTPEDFCKLPFTDKQFVEIGIFKQI